MLKKLNVCSYSVLVGNEERVPDTKEVTRGGIWLTEMGKCQGGVYLKPGRNFATGKGKGKREEGT